VTVTSPRSYRCYFFDPGGHIVGHAEYLADTDEQAVAQARKLYAKHQPPHGFEVWRLGRRIHGQGLP